MTEKEFLKAYLCYLNSGNKEETEWLSKRDSVNIDYFLEQHHKEYYEVEFHKIEETQQELSEKEGLVNEYTMRLNNPEETGIRIERKDKLEDVIKFVRILDKRVTILENIWEGDDSNYTVDGDKDFDLT